jgi:polyphenol oxidase
LAFSLLALSDLNRRSFIFRQRDGLTWLEAPNLVSLPSIVHAFSTRAAGNFRLADAVVRAELSSESGAAVESEYRHFLNALGAERFEPASVRQVHSAKAVQVAHNGERLTYEHCGSWGGRIAHGRKPEADALMSAASGVLLIVRTADCLPVLIADARRGAVAAVHAGWRGALGGIVEKTVHEMRGAFNSSPRDLAVALGPSIRACCYVVGQEVVDAFCSRFARGRTFFRSPLKRATGSSTKPLPVEAAEARVPGDQVFYLDLVAVTLDQLERAGVPGSHIDVADFCTSCRRDLFFSYRKEGAHTGRMLSVIGMRQESSGL